MNIEIMLKNLKDFSVNNDFNNEEILFVNNFKEFANQLSYLQVYFNEKNLNINNKEVFLEEIKKIANKNILDDEQYKNFFIEQVENFINTSDEKNYLDYEQYYLEYVKNLKKTYFNFDEFENFNEEKNEYIQMLEQELEANKNLYEDIDNTKQSIQDLQEVRQNFLDNNLENKEKKEVKTEEMVNFIKDKNQIYFPFDRSQTIDNLKFMRNFKKDCFGMSIEELKKMITCMQKKNEKLKEELGLLKEEKENLLKILDKEMIINSSLSLYPNKNKQKENSFNMKDTLKNIDQAIVETQNWEDEREKQNILNTKQEAKTEQTEQNKNLNHNKRMKL
ncbi:hypothetical protein FQW77_08590 [Campylobacter jejuni]|nr:hypothetical protein [Campylobacter jejuni]